MITSPNDVTIRPATSADERYVLDSFSKAFVKSPFAEGLVRSAVIAKMYSLLRSGWSCDIADCEGEIVGYVVYKQDINAVAWVCVKGPAQGKGIGTMLLFGAVGDEHKPVKQPFMIPKNDAFHPPGLEYTWRPYLVC